MFARWRNLAAAAGAFCLPLSFAHASLQCGDFHRHSSTPCTRYQDTSEESWFRSERDSWYERYYGSALDEATGNSSLTLLPIQSLQSADQPSVIILDIEPINESADDRSATENAECTDPTCPCHNAWDLNDENEMNDEAPSANAQDTSTTTPNFDIESEFFDIYAPYLIGDEVEAIPSEPEPTAELTGSIEPMFEDCEARWLQECFRGTNIKLQDIEQLWQADDLDDEEFGEDGAAVDPDDADDSGRDYHMFYPGCDWNPYYPASQKGNNAQPLLPEDLRSA